MRKMAVLLLALLLTSTAQAASLKYNPAIAIGSKTGWKNILFVFWSHDVPGSAWALRSIVRGLAEDVRQKNLSIIIYQIAGPDADEVREASLFTCVSQANYPKIVFRYLDIYSRRKGDFNERVFKRDFASAANGLDLPKRWNDCFEGTDGAERDTVFRVWREALNKKWPFDGVPVFVLNGKIIAVNQLSDVRAKMLKR